MAREVRAFDAVIPAGTPIANPALIDVSFPVRTVMGLDLLVPSGWNGVVGFQIANSGTQVIPIQRGQFVITNDERIHWDLEHQINSGSWQVIGYNTGAYPHTLHLRFLLDVIPLGAGAVDLTPSLTDLSTVPTQAESDTAAAQAALDELAASLGDTVPAA